MEKGFGLLEKNLTCTKIGVMTYRKYQELLNALDKYCISTLGYAIVGKSGNGTVKMESNVRIRNGVMFQECSFMLALCRKQSGCLFTDLTPDVLVLANSIHNFLQDYEHKGTFSLAFKEIGHKVYVQFYYNFKFE